MRRVEFRRDEERGESADRVGSRLAVYDCE
jgi:hypothetical protein